MRAKGDALASEKKTLQKPFALLRSLSTHLLILHQLLFLAFTHNPSRTSGRKEKLLARSEAE